MTSEDLPNKRDLKRHYLIYYLRVFNRENGEIIGHLVDVSPKGVMLMRDSPIEVGGSYSMRLRWRSSAGKLQLVDFDGTCRWCSHDINPDFYAAGFSITVDRKDHSEAIFGLIHDLGMPDSDAEGRNRPPPPSAGSALPEGL